MKSLLKLTYSEFVSTCWVCHQMSNFWAEVPSNNSTHMMNQSHELNLENEDEKFAVSFEEWVQYKSGLQSKVQKVI